MHRTSTTTLLETSAKRLAPLLFVWLLGYLNFSILWPVLLLVLLMSWERRRQLQQRQEALDAHQDEADMIFAHMSELPSWIINRVWPFINSAAETIVIEEVEPELRKDLPTALKNAHFERVSLGTKAPRIGGIRVYPQDDLDDPEVVIDFDFSYHSNADICLFLKYGITVGISDLRVSGKARILIKPILTRVPLFGAVSVCLLELPKIDFQLTGLANVMEFPMLRSTIDRIVQERVSKKLVFPKRIFIPLIENSADLEELTDPQPRALVIVDLHSATGIEGSDYRLFGPNTSDLYAIVKGGRRQFTSRVLTKAIDAYWNESYEFLIESHDQPDIEIEVWDQDTMSDDFIGRATILSPEIEGALQTHMDLDLTDDARERKGTVHVELTHLKVSRDPRYLEELRTMAHRPRAKAAKLSTIERKRAASASCHGELRRRQVDKSAAVSGRRHSAGGLLVSHHSSSQVESDPIEAFEVLPSLVEARETASESEGAGVTDKSGEGKETSQEEEEEEEEEDGRQRRPRAILFVHVFSATSRRRYPAPRTGLLCRLSVGDVSKNTKALTEQHDGQISWNEKFHFCLEGVHQELLRVELHESDAETKAKAWVTVNIDDLLNVKRMSTRGHLPLTDKQLGVANMSSDKADLSIHLKLSLRALIQESESSEAILKPEQALSKPADDDEKPSSFLQAPAASLPQRRIRDGLLELSFRYSHLKHRLSVNVHGAKDLVPCHVDGTSDPFVEAYIFPDKAGHGRRRTSSRRKTCNPKFDESFQFAVPFAEIHNLHICLVVRNSPFRYGAFRTYLGEVLIDLNRVNFSIPDHIWYRLQSRSETQRKMLKVDKFMEALSSALPVTSP